MADYPLPRFHFRVVVERGPEMSFTEVTGLTMEREKIEYRHSDSADFSKIVMPGMVKRNNMTFKNGKFENDLNHQIWFDEAANDRVNARRLVTISLLNEHHDPVAVWTASRCFPVKITAPDLKSDANEIAIEQLEIVHEGLKQIPI
jgi:phage tail-like protein